MIYKYISISCIKRYTDFIKQYSQRKGWIFFIQKINTVYFCGCAGRRHCTNKQIKRLTMHQNILKPIFIFLRNQVRQKVSVLELFLYMKHMGFRGFVGKSCA